jgi:hypothetical protein
MHSSLHSSPIMQVNCLIFELLALHLSLTAYDPTLLDPPDTYVTQFLNKQKMTSAHQNSFFLGPIQEGMFGQKLMVLLVSLYVFRFYGWPNTAYSQTLRFRGDLPNFSETAFSRE